MSRILRNSVFAFAMGATSVIAPAQAAEPKAASDGSDIIVTARKRDERLQDVPVAMTVFSREDLRRYDTVTLSQVAAQTPSLVAGNTAGTTGGVINLRGIGSATSSATIEQAVSINLDGIQVSQANVLLIGLQDVERIEVLKGPQALFYGKNSPGGVISILSANPTETFQARVRGGYEFAADKAFIEGTISSPLTENLGVRVTGYYSKQDGYFRNDARPIPAVALPPSLGGGATSPGIGTTQTRGPNQRDLVLRGTLAYASSGGEIDAKLKVAYASQKRKNGLTFGSQVFFCGGSAPTFVLLAGSAGSRDCALDRYVNEADAPPALAALAPMYRDGRHYFTNEQFLASLTTNFHPADYLTITSVTGYYKLQEKFSSNFTFGSSYFAGYASALDTDQFSQELRATTQLDGAINFMAGGYYQEANLENPSESVFDGPLTYLFSGGRLTGPKLFLNPRPVQKTKAWSLFGQAIVDVTPQLELSLGGRYSAERKRVRQTTGATAFNAAPYEVTFTPNRRSFHNFSPEATLTYKPTTNISIYAAYREGFKSGGFNLGNTAGAFGSRNAGDQSFDQEEVEGGEVGTKGSLLGGQLQFDITAYSYKYTGLQVGGFNATTLGFQITNAASARVKGVELSTVFRPRALDGLSLRGAVTYNQARYLKFINSQCYTGQSKAGGCNFIASSVGGQLQVRPAGPAETGNVQDLSGKALTRAPEWSGNAGFTYETGVGGGYAISISGDAIYTDDYYAQPLFDPNSTQKSVWRLNAGVTLKAPEDRWEVSLIGTNLTNVRRILSAYNTTASGGGTGTNGAFASDLAGTVTDPIGVTLSATLNF